MFVAPTEYNKAKQAVTDGDNNFVRKGRWLYFKGIRIIPMKNFNYAIAE